MAAFVVASASTAAAAPQGKQVRVDLKGDGRPANVSILETQGATPLEKAYVLVVESEGSGGVPERAEFQLPGNSFSYATVARIANWPKLLVVGTRDCGGSCSGQHLTIVGYAGAPRPRVVWQSDFEKGATRVRNGGVEALEGVYGRDDGNCCPSRSKITRYEWRGGTMKKVRERIVGADAPELKTWNDEHEPTRARAPSEAQRPSDGCISSTQCPEGLICDFSTRTCVTPGTPAAPATVQVKQVKVELRTWGMCLDLYKIEHGSYPAVHEGLLAVLADGKCKASLKDPWGNPYRYILKGGRTGVACSLGADGKHGGSGENTMICLE